MTRLQLKLFGPMQALAGETPLHFATAKVQALLAYLALEPERPYRREQLAALLWPELPDADARRNLRLTLHRLKQSLSVDDPARGELLLDAGRSTVQWQGSALDVDVTHFMQLLAQVENHDHPALHSCDICRGRLEDAASLLRGELLAGLALEDALPFEEWLLVQREFFHHQALRLFAMLGDMAEKRGDYEQSHAYARRQLALEPWYEAAHRLAMRALVLAGERERALVQYESCRAILDEELGVEPATETQTLYRQIQDNVFSSRSSAVPVHHLPADLTPFIGREDELDRIAAALRDPAGRLLTLIGPGGSGKTRLAIQAAKQFAGDHPEGCEAIYFVPLGSAGTRQAAVTTLAERLGISLSGGDDPLQEVTHHLHPHHFLLLLDNLEQLDGAASLLAAILEEAPRVQILATSREPLQLQGELRLPVGGLPFPAAAGEEVQKAPAVAFFVQSARQMSAGFRLDPAAAEAVVSLCRLVDGLPLALELAAGWVRVMDCAAILREVEQNLAFLATDLHNVPPRHRSLRAIFHQTWTMLSERLQELLAQAALFPGDFTLAAFQGIAVEVTMLDLAVLLDKSLLRRNAANHYELHPLVKQFVSGEMPPRPAWERRFSRFYLESMAARQKELTGRAPQEAAGFVRRELANVRQAWEWGIRHALWDQLAGALPALRRFYQIEGLFAEAVTGLTQVLAALGENGERAYFRGELQLGLADFLGQQGAYDRALAAAEAALALADQLAARELQGQACASIGEWQRHQGRFEAASTWLEKGIELFGPASSAPLAHAHNERGLAYLGRGQYQRAREAFQLALLLFESLDDQRGTAVTLGNLGELSRLQSNYDEARDYCQRALIMSQMINDRQSIVKHTLGLGWVALQQGDIALSQRFQREALAVAEEIGYLRGVLTAQRYIADTALFQNRLDDAEAAYRRLLHRAEQAQLNDLAAHATGNLGIVYARRGDFEAAIRQYEAAIERCRRLADPVNQRKHLNNLGSTYRRQGHHARAKAAFLASLQLERQIGYRQGEASTLLNLGALNRQEGDLDAAQAYFEQALEIYQTLQHPDGIAKGEGFMGLLHQQKGEFVEAEARFQKALALSEGLSDRLTAAVWRQSLAETAQEMGNWATAVEYISAAVAAFRQLQSRAYLAAALVVAGRILRKQGELAAARLAVEEAEAIAAVIGDGPLLFESLLLQGQLSSDRGEGESAVARLKELLQTAGTPAQQAAVHDALWQAGAGPGHAESALALYRQLLAKTADFLHQQRAAALAAVVSEPGDPSSLG